MIKIQVYDSRGELIGDFTADNIRPTEDRGYLCVNVYRGEEQRSDLVAEYAPGTWARWIKEVVTDTAEASEGPFLVVEENYCCGCSKPTFVGLYATAKDAMLTLPVVSSRAMVRWQGQDLIGWALYPSVPS